MSYSCLGSSFLSLCITFYLGMIDNYFLLDFRFINYYIYSFRISFVYTLKENYLLSTTYLTGIIYSVSLALFSYLFFSFSKFCYCMTYLFFLCCGSSEAIILSSLTGFFSYFSLRLSLSILIIYLKCCRFIIWSLLKYSWYNFPLSLLSIVLKALLISYRLLHFISILNKGCLNIFSRNRFPPTAALNLYYSSNTSLSDYSFSP